MESLPPRTISPHHPNPRAAPRPSASVILISPANQILLLQRVRTSRAFASAHVFPGGLVEPAQDGALRSTAPQDRAFHDDAGPYRNAAVRECFEESGILLARRRRRRNGGEGGLVGWGVQWDGKMEERERDEVRGQIRDGKVRFRDWLEERGWVADVENLIPFTRWLTPATMPRRYSTQMYLYFMPLPSSSPDTTSSLGSDSSSSSSSVIPSTTTITIPTTATATPDGGVEHVSARFLHPASWLSLCRSGSVILFPPQYYILHLLSQFLRPLAPLAATTTSPPINTTTTTHVKESGLQLLQQQRQAVLAFVDSGSPPFREKCISPLVVCPRACRVESSAEANDGSGSGSSSSSNSSSRNSSDSDRSVLALDHPGPELEGSGRSGDAERVVLVRFTKTGPRELDVRWRADDDGVLMPRQEESERGRRGPGGITKGKL
ncbi:MAG: hypothetical protein M1816_004056 [Peltula sp. TS41687]|nr:MAG: hypothetical protein M1816_004056 [Peltula sp. TS41687]